MEDMPPLHLSSGFVIAIKGICAIIPENAKPINACVGIPTKYSCNNAEIVNTIRDAVMGDTPRFTSGR